MNRRLGRFLSRLNKPELEGYRELLNLTEDEEKVFNCLAKGKNKTQTAMICCFSTTTIDNRIRDINEKLNRLIN